MEEVEQAHKRARVLTARIQRSGESRKAAEAIANDPAPEDLDNPDVLLL